MGRAAPGRQAASGIHRRAMPSLGEVFGKGGTFDGHSQPGDVSALLVRIRPV